MFSPTCPIVASDVIVRRTWRICILLTAVFLMGLGDLYATLTQLQSIGMIEMNPIAARLISSGSEAALICYKLGTLLLASGLILMVRQYRTAEMGSWTLLAIMTLLTIHWYSYNQVMAQELIGLDVREVASVMHQLAAR